MEGEKNFLLSKELKVIEIYPQSEEKLIEMDSTLM